MQGLLKKTHVAPVAVHPEENALALALVEPKPVARSAHVIGKSLQSLSASFFGFRFIESFIRRLGSSGKPTLAAG